MKKHLRKILRYNLRKFNNISIHNKIILIYVFIVFIPLSITSVILYDSLRGMMLDKAIKYQTAIFNGIIRDVDRRVEDIDAISKNISYNASVQSYLISSDDLPVYRQLHEINSNEAIIHSLISDKSLISAVHIISEDTNLHISQVGDSEKMDESTWFTSDLYKSIKEANGAGVWYVGSDRNGKVLYSRLIKSLQSLQYIGALVIEVDLEVLDESLDISLTNDSSELYIVDNNYHMLFASEKSKYSSDMSYIDKNISKGTEQTVSVYNVNEYTSLVNVNGNYGWTYIYRFPDSVIVSEVTKGRNLMISLYVLSGLLFLILSVILTVSITRPMKRLINDMKEVERGNFKVSAYTGRKDEVGQLGLSFSNMVEQIDLLVNSVLKEQILKKNAELKALQAQINPHFLYNALNSIYALAKINGIDDISMIAKSLSMLFRASISRDNGLVTLEEEISYVNYYLAIQKIRYKDKFEMENNIDEAILRYCIPKLTIQPLIENAFIHGLEPKLGKWLITINGNISNDVISIDVIDNGVGFENVASNIQTDFQGLGSGIENVKKRLNLTFDHKCDVLILKSDSNGAWVRMTFPAKLMIRRNNA